MKQNKWKKLWAGLKHKMTKKEEPMKLEVDNLQGIGKRHQQEDSFCMSDYTNAELMQEKGFFAVVADGMGGMLHGDRTSATVTAAAKEYFDACVIHKNSGCNQMLDMLEFIDEKVKKLQKEEDIYESGSTLTAVWIRNHMMHFMTVGDSRIYLFRGGNLYQLNRDHNLKNKLIEKVIQGEMDREMYHDMMGKSGLTSYLGKEEIDLVDVSVRPFFLEKDDVILMASDGVFGTLSDTELIALLKQDFDYVAENMKLAIENAGKKKQDNYTAIIVKCVNGEGEA
ncbi:MAG: serine/threonine-protein phosphatase [Lachnospiraceae bacterium]|nr:serine/threonine-protein phosphatase [Lachnospiraceae bacterium]